MEEYYPLYFVTFNYDDDLFKFDIDRVDRALECFLDSDLLLSDERDYKNAIEEFIQFSVPEGLGRRLYEHHKRRIKKSFHTGLLVRAKRIKAFRRVLHKVEPQQAPGLKTFTRTVGNLVYKHLPPGVTVAPMEMFAGTVRKLCCKLLPPGVAVSSMEPGFLDDPSWVPVRTSWFVPMCDYYKLIPRSHPRWRPEMPFYPPDIEQAPLLNDLRNWVLDLKELKSVLFRLSTSLSFLLRSFCPRDKHNPDSEHNRVLKLLTYRKHVLSMCGMLPHEDRLVNGRGVDSLEFGLGEVQWHLVKGVWPVFTATEECLILWERSNIDKQKLNVAISRFGRAMIRAEMNDLVNNFRTPHLRKEFQFVVTEDKGPICPEEAIEVGEDDRCPICLEGLKEVGDATTPLVNQSCCNAPPFHLDCLVTEHLKNFAMHKPVKCPVCLVRLSQDELKNVVDKATKHMGFL
ncbi:hypothetical protein PV08_01335 [Exophiala spinifera]|uniref:RING-type domain-containing protein n=1 Tax=Exophiala spinifera TaxID=91928 RepID=A0A0D2A7J5_9EURO|nr:uncharacterized protein PV08_01335 [Exophiala spinifera]KIW20757.1 hypothetical protein PV08_01335 [Exophiala spinifera]